MHQKVKAKTHFILAIPSAFILNELPTTNVWHTIEVGAAKPLPLGPLGGAPQRHDPPAGAQHDGPLVEVHLRGPGREGGGWDGSWRAPQKAGINTYLWLAGKKIRRAIRAIFFDSLWAQIRSVKSR